MWLFKVEWLGKAKCFWNLRANFTNEKQDADVFWSPDHQIAVRVHAPWSWVFVCPLFCFLRRETQSLNLQSWRKCSLFRSRAQINVISWHTSDCLCGLYNVVQMWHFLQTRVHTHTHTHTHTTGSLWWRWQALLFSTVLKRIFYYNQESTSIRFIFSIKLKLKLH